MIVGPPPDESVSLAREAVVDSYLRLHHLSKKVTHHQWRSFFAGAVCMLIHKMNTQLTRFLVEVSDE